MILSWTVNVHDMIKQIKIVIELYGTFILDIQINRRILHGGQTVGRT